MSAPRIFGFALLRNGIKYDYPYRESLISLGGLCERVFLALGNSEDDTAQSLTDLDFLEIQNTVWDENSRRGGHILSQQTGLALQALRTFVREQEIKNAWGFYLQADEVLNEGEYDLLREDIAEASAEGFDAVRFRYLHFWQRYDQIAIGKRWYPQEIRAIRLDSEIESYGDAQSFRNAKKIFESDASIFHFGHVRDPERYKKKTREFHRWWHPDHEIPEVIARGEKIEAAEETVPYLGPYPKCMEGRMKLQISKPKKVWVVGKPENYPGLESRIHAEEVLWGPETKAKSSGADAIVHLQPGILKKLFQNNPLSMKSKNARPWTDDFVLRLKFAEKGVALD
ncbi:hypothetical protein K2X30_01735 [bacterium]|nr:hypothetical protein [bacterium]